MFLTFPFPVHLNFCQISTVPALCGKSHYFNYPPIGNIPITYLPSSIQSFQKYVFNIPALILSWSNISEQNILKSLPSQSSGSSWRQTINKYTIN